VFQGFHADLPIGPSTRTGDNFSAHQMVAMLHPDLGHHHYLVRARPIGPAAPLLDHNPIPQQVQLDPEPGSTAPATPNGKAHPVLAWSRRSSFCQMLLHEKPRFSTGIPEVGLQALVKMVHFVQC